ncbi:MAG: PorV/PorQ family protein [Bacteroidota bacterium]
MKTRNVLSLLLLLAAAAMIPAGAEAGSPTRRGTAGAMELLIPVGSRGSATGGAMNAVASGVDAIHWNPAGMSQTRGVEAMFSTLSYLADIQVNYFAVASDFGDIGTFGLSLRSLDFGDIPITTVENPEGTGGTFSPNFISGSLSYARAFTDRILGGFSVKLVSERIMRTSATGIGFDLGVQYLSETGLRLGVTLKNLGPEMSYEGPDLESFVGLPSQEPGSRDRALRLPGAGFELPSVLEIGAGYRHMFDEENAFLAMGNFQNNNFAADEFRFGLEYAWRDLLFLRGGYMLLGQNNAEDNIYGVSLGAGVTVPVSGARIGFDYAYRQADFFDSNHWITVRFAL